MEMRPDMTLEQMLSGFIFVAHGSRVLWMPGIHVPHPTTLKRASYKMTDLERYFASNAALAHWLKHPARLSAATFEDAVRVIQQVRAVTSLPLG